MKKSNLIAILFTITILFIINNFAFADDIDTTDDAWVTDGDTYVQSGNVGIGTTDPDAHLHINKSEANMWGLKVENDDNNGNGIYVGVGGTGAGDYIFRADANIDLGGGTRFIILGNGNVGIGTTTPQSKLAVNGTITTKEVKVTETGWSDFVFEDNYTLPTLETVESYIKDNKHLPDVPSAKKIEEEGLSVAEMMAKQMQKIEELTLYVIELKNENEAIKQELAELKKNVN